MQLANVVSLKNKDAFINTQISAHLGLINEMPGNTKLASNYYVNSVDIADSLHTSFAYGSVANLYSHFLLKQNEFNKAKYFAEKALSAAKNAGTKFLILSTAKTLRNIYEAIGRTDSAYYYSKIELEYRDSLFNQQKVNEIYHLTFNEELRQLQEVAKEKKVSEKRRQNIQYSAIAIGIVALLILFLLLSHSIIVNAKIIEIVGVIGLLLVLEFIYLLLHPFLEKSTNHSPVVMLLALVCIASLIVPMHHRFEKWMIHKLVEKNKKIRLAAAKKTISKLEEKNPLKDQRSVNY